MPTPWRPATRFASSKMATGSSALPFSATGTPASHRTVAVSGVSGASQAHTPMPGSTKYGGSVTSSRSPASWVSPRKFASVEYRDSAAGLIGISFASQ